MTSRSTNGRRLGAVALGVGFGLLAFGIARSMVADPTTRSETSTESTTANGTNNGSADDRVSGTDAQGSSAPTVAGITVTRQPTQSGTDAEDYSMIIIGAGLAVAGGASLRLSNRRPTITATPLDPYRPKHFR